MRCAPIGIWARHVEEASMAARDDARLSHPHPVCQAASAAFVAAITTAVSGGDQEAMLTAAERAVQEPEAEAVRDRLTLARLGHGPDDFMGEQGWVLIAFHNAFRHLASGTPMEDALVETVGEGVIPTPTQRSAGRCSVLLRGAPPSRRAGAWPCWLAALSLRPVSASRGRLDIGRMTFRCWQRRYWRGRGTRIEENLSASSGVDGRRRRARSTNAGRPAKSQLKGFVGRARRRARGFRHLPAMRAGRNE
jgi:ADP-ribosylglycohydrolase